MSPEGSDDNKGSDASRPLLTVQHAVNVAADSGTTIRLGPARFEGMNCCRLGGKFPSRLQIISLNQLGSGMTTSSLLGVVYVIKRQWLRLLLLPGAREWQLQCVDKGRVCMWQRMKTTKTAGIYAKVMDYWKLCTSTVSLDNLVGKVHFHLSFNHPAVHVVELRGREPNCRISHVYFGKTATERVSWQCRLQMCM